MRTIDRALARRIDSALRSVQPRIAMPGISNPLARTVLIEQLVESVRRIKYISFINGRTHSQLRADPTSAAFDPLMAAMYHRNAGNIDEAFWLIFLSVHFGKHLRDGWKLARDVYGGGGSVWAWPRVTTHFTGFKAWLRRYQKERNERGPKYCFGNHRKYQSLDPDKATGTAAVCKSYIDWISPGNSHSAFMATFPTQSPGELFDTMYRSMSQIIGFGRTGRFDYLTMLGKLSLAAIAPATPYLQGATGPLSGAALLLANGLSAHQMNAALANLGTVLGIGMQEIEDALCNWQKSPTKFIPFRG